MPAEVEVNANSEVTGQHGLTSRFCLLTSRKMNRKLDVHWRMDN